MKLFINASRFFATGVVQVAVSFLNECKKFPEHEYHVFISKVIDTQIDMETFPPNFHFMLFEQHHIFSREAFRVRRLLKNIEKELRPDCVFTVFGPALWRPLSPHLMGYASPYYVYPESPYFKIISWKRYLTIQGYMLIHRYYLKRDGKYYVCETDDVSARLPAFLKCSKDQVFTVTNTCNEYFNKYIPSGSMLLPSQNETEFRFVTMSTFASHKNLSILNQVIPILNKRLKGIDVKFVLTVNQELFEKQMTPEAKQNIINIGRVPVATCPSVYTECDALFLPTLMECFSANYVEAMKMGKPIITSNLPFATTVCKDAALYFDPLNAEDIVEKIILLIQNKNLQKDLIAKGTERLKSFDTAETRAEKYLAICRKISNQ